MNNICIDLLKKLPEDLSSESIKNWIRFEAGSSNPDYFLCKKSEGLKLQQVPEEYSSIIMDCIGRSPKSYLEIGIGNGGSWMTFSYLNRKSLQISHSVDNLAYKQAVDQKIEEIEFIKNFLSDHIPDSKFFNMTSFNYLQSCKLKYDIIFIDGDHSYEGVKSDYENSIKNVNEGGIMIFHDIVSIGAPGVVKFWNETKNRHQYKEFISSNTCGMGILIF